LSVLESWLKCTFSPDSQAGLVPSEWWGLSLTRTPIMENSSGFPESHLRVEDAESPGHKERTPSSSPVLRIRLQLFLLTNGWGMVGGFSRSFVKTNHAYSLLCDLVAVMKD